MTMIVTIDDAYLSKFESFVASLPEGSIEMKNSLDDEIANRITLYQNNTMQTTPFMDGLDSIREKLVSKL